MSRYIFSFHVVSADLTLHCRGPSTSNDLRPLQTLLDQSGFPVAHLPNSHDKSINVLPIIQDPLNHRQLRLSTLTEAPPHSPIQCIRLLISLQNITKLSSL
jgi:hypothetical protein